MLFSAHAVSHVPQLSVSKLLKSEPGRLILSSARRSLLEMYFRGGTITLRTNVIPILALAGLFSVCAPNSAVAAKEAFTRTKPHVNVGTIGGKPAEIWFHANAGVFEDGNASGIIEARVIGGESFLYRARGGGSDYRSGNCSRTDPDA
jgi:hypothetical protein